MDTVLQTGYSPSPFLAQHDASYTPALTRVIQHRELPKAEEQEKLRRGIAELYDESSGMWEKLWGDHMHHGFYDAGRSAAVADHRFAQVRMIEETLAFAFAGNSGCTHLLSVLIPNLPLN